MASSVSCIDQKQAEIICQTNVSISNVKYLGQSIIQLSKEVEDTLLREKWASALREGEHERCAIEDALTICRELTNSPDCIDDVFKALQQKESSLKDKVASMLKTLEEMQTS